MASEESFNAAAEKITRCGIVRTEDLGACPLAAAIKARRNDARVVEDEEIASPQQVREIPELAVRKDAVAGLDVQHPRLVAGGQRLLCNQLLRKVIVEIGN